MIKSRSAWMFIGLVLFAWLGMDGSANAGVPPLRDIRKRVLAAARPAFRRWLGSLPPERLTDFGFRTPGEADRATLLPPIPSYAPERSRGLSRERIEATLESPPDSWLVPVSTGGEVVCLITVETAAGRPPEVVEFGKTWAARRLAAGLHSLGEVGDRQPGDLRFVAFVDPNVDLLLARRADGRGWRWLNLLGPTVAEALPLDLRQIDELLRRIQNTQPRDVPFP